MIINKKYNDLSSFNIQFKNSKPYPHIILDNFLDKDFFLNLDTKSFGIEKQKIKNSFIYYLSIDKLFVFFKVDYTDEHPKYLFG